MKKLIRFIFGPIFVSDVEGFSGPCIPTWLNRNRVDIRFYGMSGYFRTVKCAMGIPLWYTGKEFHGGIRSDGTVVSTEIKNW